MLLGHAGNRLNADIEELAVVATEFAPDLVVVKEDEGHLRGRQPGEVPALLQNALLKTGMPLASVPICPSEVDAAQMALDWARPGRCPGAADPCGRRARPHAGDPARPAATR